MYLKPVAKRLLTKVKRKSIYQGCKRPSERVISGPHRNIQETSCKWWRFYEWI